MKSGNLPPLGPLLSFSAAAKHQSFTKAAQQLNLTHGAVSRAVKQLEEHFGLALFERRNRRIYLTSKGLFFAKEVDNILAELSSVCEQMNAQTIKPILSVSCEPSVAMRWLMPKLNHFYQQHPTVDIQLSTAGGPVDLAAQGINLAIRRSDFQWPKDYWVTPLGKESLGPVCHPNYWLADKAEGLTLLHTRTRPTAWESWREQHQGEVKPHSEQYYDHFYFSLQAAVAGLGIAIAPQFLVEDDLANGHLIAPFGFVETPVEYVCLSLKNPHRDELLNCFIQWLMSELRSK